MATFFHSVSVNVVLGWITRSPALKLPVRGCRFQPPSFDVRVRSDTRPSTFTTFNRLGRERPMRYMILVTGSESLAASGPPPAALIEAIDRLSEEATKKGTLVSFGGLQPTSS